MRSSNLAALCAAFLIPISANAMSNTSFYLYDGALEFQCAQDSNRIKLTAKTTKHFSAKIKANTASGNSMNYGSSGGSTMNIVFGTSDFPIQFDVTNDALGVESFSLDSECQMKIKPSAQSLIKVITLDVGIITHHDIEVFNLIKVMT